MWKRAKQTIKGQLVQGADPKSLAMSCAFGCVIGVFPIFGLSTSACLLTGVCFKLNHPAMQAVNYLVYPLQFLLIPVFLRAGESMTRTPHVSLSPKAMAHELASQPWQFLHKYSHSAGLAILAWALLAIPAAILIYFFAKSVFLKIERGLKKNEAA